MTRATALAQPATSELAIVGGGSVGVSFLYQFLLALQAAPAARPPTVHIFEPQADPGPGGAYQDDLRSNLLNIPAGNMSARSDHRLDFVDWLREQDADWLLGYGVTAIDPADFLPRPLFGAYMRAVYERCRRLAETLGVTLAHVPDRVHRVVPQPDGRVHVQPDQCAPIVARHVVLCNGNLPSQAFPALDGVAGYFNSPYPVSALAQAIAPDASVCVVGTSLSAVDAVAALQQAGHRGPILCVSRNGRLPSVRSPHNRAPGTLQQLSADGALQLAARHGGALTLDVIWQALRDEVMALHGSLDDDDVLGIDGDARAALDDEIRRSATAPRPWQAVAAATNGAVDRIWHLLPDTERRRFQSTWRSLWMARRATFPMRNALKLQALFGAKQLHVAAGFAGCDHDPATGLFRTRLHTAGAHVEHSSQYLINATSFSVDAQRTADPLVSQLLRDGHAQADPHGGLALDYGTGCLKNAGGHIVAGVSVLGSLAGGTYFWTTSMDVNARLARDQAERIAATLRAAPATDPEIPGDIPSPERWTAHRPPHPAQAASS
ncbi:FAD/NAD(P)-binding protein [Achromobacter sp. UBA2119]|uniref:FAD/NAD(P)-binding protein n=1 Tax=Achromobacter sp. UBA2119 TaxID=1945911 RepID=UPI00257D9A6B|nr:FAD/NAD(P)-binding protein [Achromobacter sp. UBA2119]